MDSSEGQYGWATDDPRWTDTLAGGKGRLEPPPPPIARFDATTPPAGRGGAPGVTPQPTELPAWPPLAPSEAAAAWPPPPSPAGSPWQTVAPPMDAAPPPATTWRTPGWEAAASSTPPDFGYSGPSTALPDPDEPALQDLFGPALAIGTGPAAPPQPQPPTAWVAPPPGAGYPPSQMRPPDDAATAQLHVPMPFSLKAQYAPPGAAAERRSLPDGGVGAISSTDTVRLPVTRLDRQVQVRGRRRGDDEFRRAGRAELFSDEARYGLLYGLTSVWYAPVILLFFAWLLLGNGAAGPRLLSGLVWIAGAAALSLAVVGLLRWARVGWRAMTLSIAAALIGGGVATIAHTLTG